ncbi:hypothetical protein ACWOE3_03435 [Enterococcus dispar]|uniref:Glycosyl transferase family 1 domain-containing protein n=1 Tax=Enterococcus dispar ATCC 51266 TaxID=1139219 RepID=S1ND18_9ENTE|nr:hypothetical protein [Enterococcus dispar]EOT41449.1 hypothetical protein OMK_01625 [Enterococcus dispar ATCC 51266]EOW86917.1 hypothetical protein I569_02281 [Enterococcus dispar ATCC 51266]OJG39864.1 hypothetical protein RV01_GL001046 [Enterococcus dispar]
MEWLLIHPFGYTRRTELLEKILSEKEINFTIIASDYSHVKKQRVDYSEKNENIEVIRAIKYKKNLSIKRILSHIHFSFLVLLFIKKNNPQKIYCRIPPNFLLFLISCFCKDSKLIVDVYDLWPESFPQKKSFLLNPFFKVWKFFRNGFINSSDSIVLECNLYRKYLPHLNGNLVTTIYPESSGNDLVDVDLNGLESIKSEIHFCYLGTINNIVDFSKLEVLFELVSMKSNFFVHFIGRGEKKQYLIDLVSKYDGVFIDYGPIYNDKEKNFIMNQCHFGLNIFKDQTVIGLSLKSIEYFKFGLPIISTLKGDTAEFIDRYNVGIMFDDVSFIKLKNFYSKYKDVREEVRNLYMKEFENNVLEKKWRMAIGGLSVEK